ncbi:hypothetical protein SADUNF_Sadunf05G0120100 [Salix dunnii]|uniref:Uncharacterized protein n=1 Tax=Salix dunnii TaxID=1413687 RepID=A0A835K3R4_9ROSI|nr:hypothetical protein SADUNF_Sadunf05G0120100 [Salix dunnii]
MFLELQQTIILDLNMSFKKRRKFLFSLTSWSTLQEAQEINPRRVTSQTLMADKSTRPRASSPLFVFYCRMLRACENLLINQCWPTKERRHQTLAMVG